MIGTQEPRKAGDEGLAEIASCLDMRGSDMTTLPKLCVRDSMNIGHSQIAELAAGAWVSACSGEKKPDHISSFGMPLSRVFIQPSSSAAHEGIPSSNLRAPRATLLSLEGDDGVELGGAMSGV